MPTLRASGHGHLWRSKHGTGLHAPIGELIVEVVGGRLCCHLCGRWFVSLAEHVRVHGHTAASYRAEMGLCTTEPLVSADLGAAISARQARAYRNDGRVRDRLAAAENLRRTGELTARARKTLETDDPPQRAARRRASLDAGRRTQATLRRSALSRRLEALGFESLPDCLRDSYENGASLDDLARTTGLGRARLRAEMTAAGVTVRAPGQNTPTGRRSRARTNDDDVARRLDTDDLVEWLRRRRREGWSLARLAAATGHSIPWVRQRLAPPANDPTTNPTADRTSASRGSPAWRALDAI